MTKARIYYLVAQSAFEMNMWISHLTQHSCLYEENQKIDVGEQLLEKGAYAANEALLKELSP